MTEPLDLDDLDRRREVAVLRWQAGDSDFVYDFAAYDILPLLAWARAAEARDERLRESNEILVTALAECCESTTRYAAMVDTERADLAAALARADAAEARVAELIADWDAKAARLEDDLGTENDGLRAMLASREQQMGALEKAARAVVARGGHGDGCLIRDYGGCTCGWEQALADLASLVWEDA